MVRQGTGRLPQADHARTVHLRVLRSRTDRRTRQRQRQRHHGDRRTVHQTGLSRRDADDADLAHRTRQSGIPHRSVWPGRERCTAGARGRRGGIHRGLARPPTWQPAAWHSNSRTATGKRPNTTTAPNGKSTTGSSRWGGATGTGRSSFRRVTGQRSNWQPAKTRTTTRSRTTTNRKRTTTRTADVTRRRGSSDEAACRPWMPHVHGLTIRSRAYAAEVYGGTRETVQMIISRQL